MRYELPQVEGVEHRFIDANGLRVHVAEAGSSDSTEPPVLLLHGWPQHWYMWCRVIGALRDERRLLAPDLRGFGWSEAPGHGYDGETFAADQIALLDALGIERAFIAGHDWGGWTAILLGLLHPGRLERLMAFNAPHPWARITPRLIMEGWRGWYTWMIATPGLGPQLSRQGWVARTILTRGNVGDPFTQEEIEGYVGSFRERSRALAVSRLYRHYQRVFREAVRGKWRDHRLTVPTRIVFGERDRYVSPKLLPGFEPYAEDMKVELVPDSGHFIVDEKPDLVVARLREFLR
ncbi:MAG TPA: alpha/beta hydrolase [Solirubrobacterales bacterium]|nr:alpha/beta hydrolase [Solirubrobacterales bacterium]